MLPLQQRALAKNRKFAAGKAPRPAGLPENVVTRKEVKKLVKPKPVKKEEDKEDDEDDEDDEEGAGDDDIDGLDGVDGQVVDEKKRRRQEKRAAALAAAEAAFQAAEAERRSRKKKGPADIDDEEIEKENPNRPFIIAGFAALILFSSEFVYMCWSSLS